MSKKKILVSMMIVMVFVMGFTTGYNNAGCEESITQTSEHSLLDSVNQYASNVITDIESEYIDVGVKASIGITDINIKGDQALVRLMMERYDPLIQDSFKSYHVTQWRFKEGRWVI